MPSYKILFITFYPDSHWIKEGMSQRIMAIDQHFSDEQRAYLHLSPSMFYKKQRQEVEGGVTVYRLNLFKHFFRALKLLRSADVCYFHSVYNVSQALPLIPFIKKTTRIVLDIHGVVPEENKLEGKQFLSKWYNMCERYVIGKAKTVIAVTQEMVRHFRGKYPQHNPEYLVYNILPNNVIADNYTIPDTAAKEGRINIVYSGHLQVWQNIPLMVDLIRANLSDRVVFYILSGDPDGVKHHLKEKGLSADMEGIVVDSVSPSRLREYYDIAHYGFVLRDDIVVNHVACPTKIVEYLHYGIIPIVKSEQIGDFLSLGYEYIHYNDLSPDLPARKSARNHAIVKELIEKNRQVNFRQLLLKA